MRLLNFLKETNSRGVALVAVSSTLIFVAMTSVSIRLIGRFFVLRTSGKDDWCVLAASITSIATLASIAVGQ
jgi:hypothetical protein